MNRCLSVICGQNTATQINKRQKHKTQDKFSFQTKAKTQIFFSNKRQNTKQICFSRKSKTFWNFSKSKKPSLADISDRLYKLFAPWYNISVTTNVLHSRMYVSSASELNFTASRSVKNAVTLIIKRNIVSTNHGCSLVFWLVFWCIRTFEGRRSEIEYGGVPC